MENTIGMTQSTDSLQQLQSSSMGIGQSKQGGGSVGRPEGGPPPPPPGGVSGTEDVESSLLEGEETSVPPFSIGQGMDSAEIQEEAGAFKSFMDELSDEDEEEVQDFIKSTMDSIMSGDYDSDAVSEAMPEALSAYAEESGVDLLSRFESINNNNGQVQSRINNNVYHFDGQLSSVTGNSPEDEMIAGLFSE